MGESEPFLGWALEAGYRETRRTWPGAKNGHY
jgi:hypothetical protein